MDKGLITQLQILKLSNIKPNFSELARLYDLDRRTVKRYYMEDRKRSGLGWGVFLSGKEVKMTI
ncbi:hypothetical protein NQ488_03640 [[Bacteroides] pectinophilus]|nr:hypothetical protein NQ488_03640 [[Bacteroides] pectinophilus]